MFNLPEKFKEALPSKLVSPSQTPMSSVPPSLSPPSSRRRIKIIILALLVILLLAFVAFLLFSPIFKPTTLPKPLFEKLQSLTFPGEKWKEKFEEHLVKAQNAKKTEERFKEYQTSFKYLSDSYSRLRDPQIRQAAEEFRNFLQKTYPKQYKSEEFAISCLDVFCKEISYPEPLAAIKERIGKLKLEATQSAQINDSLERALFYSGQNPTVEFNYYVSIYRFLAKEYEKTKDKEVAAIAKDLEVYLQAQFPEIYNSVQTLNWFTVK